MDLEQEVRHITNRIGRLSSIEHEQSDEIIRSIDHLTTQEMDDSTAMEILQQPMMDSCVQTIRSFWNRYESEQEYAHALTLIGSNDHCKELENYPFYGRFERFIKEEGTLAALRSKDTVAFLGSGPLPLTAIMLNRLYGVSVDCFDSSSMYVETARQVVHRLGLEKSITSKQGYAQSIPLNGYSHIWVAALATPKKEILENITNPSTRVLVRNTYGIRTLVYEPVSDEALINFNILGQWRASGDVKNSSLVVQRKA